MSEIIINTKLRTQEEMAAKMKSLQTRLIQFQSDIIGPYMEYEFIKEFLKPGVTKEEWDKDAVTYTTDSIYFDMNDYISFAWDKANDMRGISANRSVDKYNAWIWLLGDDKIYEEYKAIKYEFYGKPHLIFVCKLLNIDHTKYDDGERTNG